MLCCLIACAIRLAGCGSSSSHRSNRAPPRETVDPPAAVPLGWQGHIDDRGGFSLSLPPGWTATQTVEGSTLVRSSDRALAIDVSADRSDVGERDDPSMYLRRVEGSLRGYRQLRFDAPRALGGLRYTTATASGTGIFARTGVHQAIDLYALARGHQVTYTFAAFRGVEAPASRYRTLLREILRSFRARPSAV
jgi:hypothetical protein